MSHPSFHLSLTVLVHYRSFFLFSLGGWFPPIPTGYVPRGTWEFPRALLDFAYQIFTVYDQPFQTVLLSSKVPYWAPATPFSCKHEKSLDCYHFARRYLGNLVDLYSSSYLDVSVRTVPTLACITFLTEHILRLSTLQSRVGFPIRTPLDQSFVAAPQRLSRPCTSFFGKESQGIHCLRSL